MCFVVSCNRVRNYVQFGTRWPAGFGTKSFFFIVYFLIFQLDFLENLAVRLVFEKNIVNIKYCHAQKAANQLCSAETQTYTYNINEVPSI